ncbi:tetratricopeptide repeat protein [Gloeobacter violaceus]|uniref:Glr2659 protein n=1 Tax=Gloeobacter violaceus (strain ATCC 29082 / PCC 7421) TaxID=251221 RepID=Q7NH78_GLOVI|nr:hypothetical protein [Gloeobacter violaceus]BAC90600.1 glr2659 [Gloeobacter violaceus PCC 7421]
MPDGITEEYFALQHFTNRHSLTRRFATRLHSNPTPQTVLCLHGDGGNGKSLLLRYWYESACKLFQDWEQANANDDDRDFVNRLTALPNSHYLPILSVFHDFGQPGCNEEQPQHDLYGTLMIHNALVQAAITRGLKHCFVFPRFSFAIAWSLHRTGKSKQEIRPLFPTDAVFDFVAAIVDSAIGIPIATAGNAVRRIIANYTLPTDEQQLRVQFEGQLDEHWMRELCQRNPRRDLLPKLPELLAKDINDAMARFPKARIVLLFDAHQAFWGTEQDAAPGSYHQRDEWFRRFLLSLDLAGGIVVVVASREPPRWSEASRHPISRKHLESELVGHLTEADGREYLQKLNISTPTLQSSMLRYASVRDGEIHPLYLALCADLVLAARNQEEEIQADTFAQSASQTNKPRELLERLTHYANEKLLDILEALSACRSFDLSVFRVLGQSLNFDTDDATFRVLCRYSFVWPTQNRNGSYRIHDLMRRLNTQFDTELTRRAHELLIDYYQREGNLAESIYHCYCLDQKQGIASWWPEFLRAERFGNYELCRNLLDVLVLMDISGLDKVTVLLSVGLYFANLGQLDEARSRFTEAIDVSDELLALEPQNVSFVVNKSSALMDLADIQARTVGVDEAIQVLRQAIAVVENALESGLGNTTDDDKYLTVNKLRGLFDLAVLLKYVSILEAKERLNEALLLCRETLLIFPDFTSVLFRSGLILDHLARMAEHEPQLSNPEDIYNESISTYDRLLELQPENFNGYKNRAVTFDNLARWKSLLNDCAGAEENFVSSIINYDIALELSPDYFGGYFAKGNTLFASYRNLLKMDRYPEALQRLNEAVEAYSEALQRIPNNINCIKMKGLALFEAVYLSSYLSLSDSVSLFLQNALVAFETYLQNCPDDLDMQEKLSCLRSFSD